MLSTADAFFRLKQGSLVELWYKSSAALVGASTPDFSMPADHRTHHVPVGHY